MIDMVWFVWLLLYKLNVFLFAFVTNFFLKHFFNVTVLCILFYDKWIEFTVLCCAAYQSFQFWQLSITDT